MLLGVNKDELQMRKKVKVKRDVLPQVHRVGEPMGRAVPLAKSQDLGSLWISDHRPRR